VGTRNVYIAQLRKTIFGIRLLKFARAGIQTQNRPGEEMPKTQQIAQTIKRLMRENNIAAKKVFTAIAGRDV
jgi:Tfp pilus assembly PilM family ATPase